MNDLFTEHGPQDAERDIFTVSRLNFEARTLLESSFSRIWLEGEISNLARPRSGHIYFSLKDAKSQVRCVMFKSVNSRLKFEPTDGLQVLVRAQVGMYEPRGEFQLMVQSMQEYGTGLLLKKLEQLKTRLKTRGWLDDAKKQTLPQQPRAVGVVTSNSGAAIHDILSTFKLRFPAISIIIYPVTVQGAQAADEIARAIGTANERAECDALIVGRGGGSLEDLWAFNELEVARAIYESKIPVVSAVGHESDVSISDLVADVRAATPTQAAQLLSPDQEVYQRELTKFARVLGFKVQNHIKLTKVGLDVLVHKIPKPKHIVQQLAQTIDEMEQRLSLHLEHKLKVQLTTLANFSLRLKLTHPRRKLADSKDALGKLSKRLNKGVNLQLTDFKSRLNSLSRNLNAISPLAVLARGYAIAEKLDGKIIKSKTQVQSGDELNIRLAQGKIKVKAK